MFSTHSCLKPKFFILGVSFYLSAGMLSFDVTSRDILTISLKGHILSVFLRLFDLI